MSATPRYATERTDRETYGPKVAEVAEALGFTLMPWQVRVLDTALEHVDGRLVYRDVLISVPRQSAKTTTSLLMLTWRMLAAPVNAVYGAQTRLASRQKLLDEWSPVLARAKPTRQFWSTKGTGSESIRSPNGSIVRSLSTDQAAGHGSTLSVAILDEAWALEADAEQGVRPAMSTKRNGQLWICSTAGTSRSTWWREKVELGREAVEAGRTDGLAFFEWAAEPDDDLDDPAVLERFHPAIGHTVDADTIRADIAAMSPAQARRAYGNVWMDDGDAGWRTIGEEQWEAAAW
jgi:phage terminase large subunit-like protein